MPDVPEGKGEMEQLNATKSKEYLADAAKDFINQFDPAQQKQVMQLARHFDEAYGELEYPAGYNDIYEETEPVYDPNDFFRGLARFAESGNPAFAAQAVWTYTYNINFKAFTGEYEPGIQSWVKKKDSDDIIYRFKNANSQPVELKITASKDNSDVNINYTEEWYDGKEEYYYNISCPHKVEIKLTDNGTELVNAVVNSKVDINGHTAHVDFWAKVANIEAEGNMDATDSKITSKAETKIDGKSLVIANATINGSNLCNKDRIQKAIEDGIEEDTILSFIHDGTGATDVMGKVQVFADVNLNRDVLKFEDCFDYYDYNDKVEAKEACDKLVRALNENVRARVKYDGKQTEQATLVFKTALDEWNSGNSWEYYVDGLLKFAADDTEYSFDEYFSKGFSSVTDLWDATIDSYEKVWNVK